MVIKKEASKNKDGIYNRIMELLDQEIIIDLKDEDNKEILEGISKIAKLSVSNNIVSKNEVFSDFSDLKINLISTGVEPFNGRDFWLYIHYKNKDKPNIINHKLEHNHLIKDGYFKFFPLNKFMYKELEDLKVKFLVKKEDLTLMNIFNRSQQLELCVDSLNQSFNDKLKKYLKENISIIFIEKYYGIRILDTDTYPPIDLLLDENNESVFSLEDILYYIDTINDWFDIVNLENNQKLLTIITKRVVQSDVPKVLKFLRGDFFLSIMPYYKRKNQESQGSAELMDLICEFEEKMEMLIEEYLYKRSSVSIDNGAVIRMLHFVKKYDWPNILSSQYKLKISLVNSIISQLKDIEDVYDFVDTFKDFDIIDDLEENKTFEEVEVYCEYCEEYLVVLKKINSISSDKYPLKEYVSERIKVTYTYIDEPAIPLINKESFLTLQEINLTFKTNIPQSIINTCELIFN